MCMKIGDWLICHGILLLHGSFLLLPWIFFIIGFTEQLTVKLKFFYQYFYWLNYIFTAKVFFCI